MAELQIVLGRPGSGKSFGICEKIRAYIQDKPIGPPIYWIVPDGIAFTTERMLLDNFETSLRAEVITMQRFAERIAGEVGNDGVKIINTTGKRLLLASVYGNSFQHLGPFRRDKPSMAFFDSILQAFDELSQQLVNIEQLEGAIESAAASLGTSSHQEGWASGSSLLEKLRDLCVLYIHYRHAADSGQFLDPVVFLTEVSPMVHRFEPMREAVVFFDGFVDMSPQVMQFALELTKYASHAELTVSIDPEWLEDDGFCTWRTTEHPLECDGRDVSRLVAMMRSCRNENRIFMPKTLLFLVDLLQTCRKNQLSYHIRAPRPYERYENGSDLHSIAQHMYGDIVVKPVQSLGSVRIATANNSRGEVAGIAREIKRMAVEKLIPYDKIAILVPSVDAYKGYIEELFSQYRIPYHLDLFPPLTEYPLAKFLLAALSVIQEGFSTSSVVRLMKTDFCGLTQEEADWFEIYVQIYEIGSSHEWLTRKNWSYATNLGGNRNASRLMDEDARAERYRQRLIRYLAPFYEVLTKPVNTSSAISRAIWSLFVAVDAKQVIANWMVNEDGSQNPLDASLHEQAWQHLVSLCDDLSRVAPKTTMATIDLVHIVSADMARVSLTTIPTAVNHVLITDFSRASGWTASVVFVAGLTDKTIPKRCVPSGLLQDEERIAFHRLFGVPLGYTSACEQLAQRTEIYHMLTRADKELVLSYPKVSTDGREARPSTVLHRVESMFAIGSLPHVVWQNEHFSFDFDCEEINPVIVTPDVALDMVIDGARTVLSGGESPLLSPLLGWFNENGERKQVLSRALRGFIHHHDGHKLGSELAQALYGVPMKMNVYQLESFAACPFKHFAQYGLKINAQDIGVVTPATKGTLMHDVLLSFVGEHMKDMVHWRQLSDSDAAKSIERHFRSVMESSKFAMWHKEIIRQAQANDVLESLRLAAVMLTHHAQFGRFSPYAVELSFGLRETDSLPGFDVVLDDGVVVSLRGRIDRIDLLTEGREAAFRVVDYKSSQLDIDLTKVEHGLRLQLPIYAAAIECHSKALFGDEATAVGMLYIPVLRKVELKNAPFNELRAQVEVQKRLRARGWMLADEEVVEAMDKRLLSGEDTELFSRVYTKTKILAKYAPALHADEWQMIIGRALNHVKTLGERILSGDVSVSPYRIGLTETACQTCPFQALCHIDPNYDQQLYRKLDKVSRADIRDKWEPYMREVKK